MNHTIPVVFNWSGGKDSALALYKLLRDPRYTIVSLLTTTNKETARSTMHGIPQSILIQQAESIGLPLYEVQLKPKGSMDDYAQSMLEAVEHFKSQGVNQFAFGDIYLEDVKHYREEQLEPYGITLLEPLWGIPTETLMEEFLNLGFLTKLITLDASLLDLHFVGKTLSKQLIEQFPSNIDICGENGEYHTFCYDGPLFKKPIKHQLGNPITQSFPMKLEDGTQITHTYHFANLQNA